MKSSSGQSHISLLVLNETRISLRGRAQDSSNDIPCHLTAICLPKASQRVQWCSWSRAQVRIDRLLQQRGWQTLVIDEQIIHIIPRNQLRCVVYCKISQVETIFGIILIVIPLGSRKRPLLSCCYTLLSFRKCSERLIVENSVINFFSEMRKYFTNHCHSKKTHKDLGFLALSCSTLS